LMSTEGYVCGCGGCTGGPPNRSTHFGLIAPAGHWGMAYRGPCRKSETGLYHHGRGKVTRGVWPNLLFGFAFDFDTSAPAAGAQRAPGSPTDPRHLPLAP
jgi:hypothetical protein